MFYQAKCNGRYLAIVEITTKQYGTDTYTNYKTLSCPCTDSDRARQDSDQGIGGPTHQLQIL